MSWQTWDGHRSWGKVYGEGDDRFSDWIDMPGWPTREEMKKKPRAEVDEVMKVLLADIERYDARRAEVARLEAEVEKTKNLIAQEMALGKLDV